MPPSKAPGGIFVGLSTTNWANRHGDRGFCPRCRIAAAFLRPVCPDGPVCSTGRPSSLFPVRLNIQPVRQLVAKMKNNLGKTVRFPLSQPSNLELPAILIGNERH